MSEHTETAAELLRFAAEIDALRKTCKPAPSDRAWVKRWPALGSAKTWAKITNGDLDGLNVASHIVKYRGVLAALNVAAEERASEEFYDDLAPAQAVCLTAMRLIFHRGKDRLVLIEGGSGSGKTTSLEILSTGQAAGAVFTVEADETWKSLRAALGDIILALGEPEKNIGASVADRMKLLIAVLKRRGRIILAIDEAHHCTGAVLNTLKTALNRTEVMIILAGMNTLLRKLRATASEEAKQLIHNRLFARIELRSPDAEGVATFLARRLQGGTWSKSTLNEVAKAARNAGHWAFLRRVVDLIQDESAAGDLDDATLIEAVRAALAEIS